MQFPESSDYGYGAKAKSREVLIPIIILIIIGVVILGKTTTLLCAVPVLGDIFCGTDRVMIAVIGDFNADQAAVGMPTVVTAPELEKELDGAVAAVSNVFYMVYRPSDLEFAAETILNKYDIAILVGDRHFTRTVRTAVENFIGAGGRLIIIGDAATRDPEDLAILGWGNIIGIPVELKMDADIDNPIDLTSPTLMSVDPDHAIMQGYQYQIRMQELGKKSCASVEMQEVIPGQSNQVVAFMTGQYEGAKKDMVAIVEGNNWLGGKTFYFAFDPGCLPNMFWSSVEYMTGKTI